ncbi:hypothetical protein DM15PD_01750 [Aristophania vespae]|nr:hypothetical protein DM15PD_01750 [Aristophania vespae]
MSYTINFINFKKVAFSKLNKYYIISNLHNYKYFNNSHFLNLALMVENIAIIISNIINYKNSLIIYSYLILYFNIIK